MPSDKSSAADIFAISAIVIDSLVVIDIVTAGWLSRRIVETAYPVWALWRHNREIDRIVREKAGEVIWQATEIVEGA